MTKVECDNNQCKHNVNGYCLTDPYLSSDVDHDGILYCETYKRRKQKEVKK